MKEINNNLYYVFDIDDNLLYNDTKIVLEKKNEKNEWIVEELSTTFFSEIRNDLDKYGYRYIDNQIENSFINFYDNKNVNNFLKDFKNSIDNKRFGPSWDKFIECLKTSSIFSIISARGNSSNYIREAVEYTIDNMLTVKERYNMYVNAISLLNKIDDNKTYFNQYINKDEKYITSKDDVLKSYLDICEFYGVSNPNFVKDNNFDLTKGAEQLKIFALDKFVNKCHILSQKIGTKTFKMGFSDDDLKNLEHIHTYFKGKHKELSEKYINCVLSVYNTNNPNCISKKSFKNENNDNISSGRDFFSATDVNKPNIEYQYLSNKQKIALLMNIIDKNDVDIIDDSDDVGVGIKIDKKTKKKKPIKDSDS